MMLEPNSGDGGNRTHGKYRPKRTDQIPVPLRDRTGAVIAFAVLDATDAHRWYLDKGYARRWPGIYLHREVMGIGSDDGRYVDHVNGLPLDNRRANLRLTTIAENAQNLRRRAAPKSSRYRGVTWDKSRSKWMASGTLNGRRTTIGRFDSEDEAGAYAAAWRARHMPFAREAT